MKNEIIGENLRNLRIKTVRRLATGDWQQGKSIRQGYVFRKPVGRESAAHPADTQTAGCGRPDLSRPTSFIDIYAALDDNERAEYQRDCPDEA